MARVKEKEMTDRMTNDDFNARMKANYDEMVRVLEEYNEQLKAELKAIKEENSK